MITDQRKRELYDAAIGLASAKLVQRHNLTYKVGDMEEAQHLSSLLHCLGKCSTEGSGPTLTVRFIPNKSPLVA